MGNNKRFLQGNIAICEGAIDAGCVAYFGYPITPQNEITNYMSKRMLELGRVFLQAESELSAINMVLGASVCGARAMTSSSSPGISLMQEGISYLAGCELPALIVNVQRGGPGLGNISGSQGDYYQATRGGGHGDYRTIVLAPYNVEEMYRFPFLGFSLAEKYHIPVIILADGYLGQMYEAVDIESFGKEILEEETYSKDWVLDGCRGREPRKIRSLYMGLGELEEHNLKLWKKYKEIEEKERRVHIENVDDADVLLIAFGIAARICKAAITVLRKEYGVRAGLFRPITLWPFPDRELRNVVNTRQNMKLFVIELNLGQMIEDVKLSLYGTNAEIYFYGRPGGSIFTLEEVVDYVRRSIEKKS
jgi:2-oxoglutarate ferredoxin oxidoreductase subunit alpha